MSVKAASLSTENHHLDCRLNNDRRSSLFWEWSRRSCHPASIIPCTRSCANTSKRPFSRTTSTGTILSHTCMSNFHRCSLPSRLRDPIPEGCVGQKRSVLASAQLLLCEAMSSDLGPHVLTFAFWFGVFNNLLYRLNWNTSIVGENVGLCGYRHTTIQWPLLTMTYPRSRRILSMSSSLDPLYVLQRCPRC